MYSVFHLRRRIWNTTPPLPGLIKKAGPENTEETMYFRIRTLPSNATMPVLTKPFNLFVELPNDLLLPIIEGSMNVGQLCGAGGWANARPCGTRKPPSGQQR